MIDNGRTIMDNYGILAKINKDNLINPNSKIDEYGEIISESGKYGELFIHNRRDLLSISNSIRKHIIQDRWGLDDILKEKLVTYDITRGEYIEMTNRIGQDVGINIKDMHYTSIEFGYNIELSLPFLEYKQSLVHAPGAKPNNNDVNMKSFVYSPTNNFATGTALKFYDAGKKYKTDVGNVMRVEMRIPQRVRDRLDLNRNLRVRDLHDKEIWDHILVFILERIRSIKCRKELENTNISSTPEFFEFTTNHSCEENPDNLEYYLDVAKRNLVKKNISKNQYYTIRNKLLNNKHGTFVVKDELKNEVIEKIKEKHEFLVNN